MVTSRLLSPVNYLFIQHRVHARYSFILPTLAAILGTFMFRYIGSSVRILGDEGLLHILVEPLQFLIGFYIAALAAIATFNSSRLDEVIDGSPPRLRIPAGQGSTSIALTQRKLLALLFGYLSMVTLLIYVGGNLVEYLAPLLMASLSSHVLKILRYIAVFLIILFGTNILTTTLLGLYYLSLKLVETDTRIRPRELGAREDQQSSGQASA